MKDNIHKREEEEGGEFSQAEWPGEKRHHSELGDVIKEKIKIYPALVLCEESW